MSRLGLSISKLKTYETCPYRYYLQYIAKIKIDKKDYNPKFFKIGQFAHKYLDSKIKGTICKFDSETLTADDKSQVSNRCDLALKDEFIQNLLKLEHWTEKPFSINFDLDTGKIEVAPKYSRKADIAGFVDFLAYDKKTQTLYVIDWKTGNVAKDEPKTFEQVFLYARAILELLNKPVKKIVVGYYYIDHNVKLIKEVSPKELDEFIVNLMERGIKIPQSTDENDFPPTPGTHCKYCPYGENGNNYCKYSLKESLLLKAIKAVK